MNIAFFTATYKPTVNGITYYISSYKKVLEDMGHKVYVFAPSYSDYKDKEKNIVRMPSLPNPLVKNYPLTIPFFFPVNSLKKLKLDVVHTHHPFVVSTFAKKVADELGIPLVYTNHTRSEKYVEYYAPFAKDEIKKYVREEIRKFANHCNLVISPTEDMKKLLKEYKVRSRITVLENCIDTDAFVNAGKLRSRKELNLPEEAKILIYVGRMDKEKHISHLINTVNSLQRKNFILLLVGDGKESKNIERVASKNKKIVFYGNIDRDKLPVYYSSADFFVTASLTEVMPLTVLEANSCKIPTVGIESVGMNGLIVDGENGFLAKNVSNFADAINKALNVLEDKKSYELMSENARKTAEKHSINLNAKKLIALYKGIR